MVKIALQKVIDWIEDHLTEDITLDQCGEVAGYSKYHLHRLFQLYVSKTLMEYVRERRLTYAMKDVSNGMRILDVAILYGYQSERAFSRAFCQYHKATPGSCRHRSYLIVPPLSVHELTNVGGIMMENYLSEVFFTNLDDMVVVSKRVFSNNPEDEVIESLTEWVREKKYVTTGRAFGFDVPVEIANSDPSIRGYEYWICIKEPVDDEGLISCKRVKGGKYIGMRIEDPFSNPFDRIPKGWGRLTEAIKAAELEDKAYKPGSHCLEEVKEVDGKTVMDIYVGIDG